MYEGAIEVVCPKRLVIIPNTICELSSLTSISRNKIFMMCKTKQMHQGIPTLVYFGLSLLCSTICLPIPKLTLYSYSFKFHFLVRQSLPHYSSFSKK